MLTFVVLTLTAAGVYFVPNMPENARTMLLLIQVALTFFIVWKLAAGYGLYWASSSVVGLLQTLWLRREYSRTAV
jgi:membrane protein insertase Oxa1/YidC/SpoIIIJ